MKSSEIRQLFLDYFEKQGHHIVASSALVPKDDPTLLFTNAGMVQFKDVFLGIDPRSYQRAVSSQRCLRAGGKHNDLENVGYTARHHTFFEMLGNFSFGDYFKSEAIRYAWNFLTQVLKLPEERLWVTVYTEDDEAADIWLKEIGVSSKRFSRCGEKDNFWSMGDTGPCGPCTEIFYDHGADIAGGPPGSPEEDGDRYIEIWNLVFMQYNRGKDGTLSPLPKPSVDTGMGLERIAAVVQGVHNNYHIDSFQHIIKAILALSPTVDKEHPSLKVIADHIRACAFLIADGVIPGNEGRAYVLRRIIRRAIRHGQKIGLNSPFFSQLLPALIDVMGDAYPELLRQKQQIIHVLDQEEEQFNKTLAQGLGLLKNEMLNLSGKEIPGELAFKLYDTYGFPIDLTADIAREQGMSLDMAGFDAAMQQQRSLSQAASRFQSDYLDKMQSDHLSHFHGYEKESLQSRIIGIVKEGDTVEKLAQGEKALIILDHTPFYAESGGQVGDQGYLLAQDVCFKVQDTQKSGQAIIHYGELLEGEMHTDQAIYAEVNSQRRQAIRLNHTATHLLHAALKSVLGEHIQQKGSLVDAERARFDFSHMQALSSAEIDKIEQLVNKQIRENQKVETALMPFEEARNSGAVALFGEKYSDEVRVLSIGSFSKELCGGTHAQRTGDLGFFKIVSEYGVASGIRRIEMLTGDYALQWLQAQGHQIQKLEAILKTSQAAFPEKIQALLEENKQFEKEISRLKQKMAQQSGRELTSEAERVAGIHLLLKAVDGMDMKSMRDLLDQLKTKLTPAVIILYAIDGDKISVICGISKDIVNKMPSAVSFVRLLCGKGGGREDMAQGGGPLPDDLDKRLAQIKPMMSSDGD